MAITYKMLYRHIRQVLGSELGNELIPEQVVDLAQEWLVASRNWRFLQAREVFLSVRGSIPVTAGIWDEVNLTLVQTGLFANYSWLEGDQIKVTGGTGITTGYVDIASRTDDDTLVLGSSIGAAAATDVTGIIELPRIGLPADFRAAVALNATESTSDNIDWVSPGLLNAIRSVPSASGAIWWRAAIDYVGTPPRPVLSLHPVPAVDEDQTFRLVYNAGVTRASGSDPDSTILNLPPWFEPLLVETVRAYALGLEPTKAQNLSLMLENIQAGPLYRSAVVRDTMTQSRYGRIRNGAAGAAQFATNELATEAGGPQ